MTYILVIWTIVGFAGTQVSTHPRYDWRPIGEFSSENGRVGPTVRSASEMCEEAARQLQVGQYRCVRSK